MNKNRLEAFSDGVLAVIITIMVLELKAPHGSSFAEIFPLVPIFCSYVLSFIYVGIYWNNHHHLYHLVKKVSAGVMWANLHLLFWLSLTPFVTSWASESHFAPIPVAIYGFVLMMAGVAYYILVRRMIASEGSESLMARTMKRDVKGQISIVFYAAAIGLSFFEPWMACGIYILVAIMWLYPDRRVENALAQQ